ncbi:MAG: glycosidase [Chlorobi bacterium]|nr:glycosidase [Chlorobiota bacterium]
MKLAINRLPIIITPDSKRVFARHFFYGDERAIGIIQKVLDMPEQRVEHLVRDILRDFSRRHRRITNLLMKHFGKVSYVIEQLEIDPNSLTEWRKLLIGAYFTMEYSIESAAIFNPSVVEDPDQDGLDEGQKRLIISFRATGEGHISSLVFRRALLDGNQIKLVPSGRFIDGAEVIKGATLNKKEFEKIVTQMKIDSKLYKPILNVLPDTFSYSELKPIILDYFEKNNLTLEEQKTLHELRWLAKSFIDIKFSLDTDISERVIFPISKYEMKGIEDARFVKFFNDDGSFTYYATYTAYDGFSIMPKLLETKDFYHFNIRPLHGKYAVDKNLALFPEKINGKYAMISRIDGVNTYIMFSDTICCWDEEAKILLRPEYHWELVQIGNGGSPIKTDRGWLLITHGVGPMRKYCLGAYLLDLNDPTRVLGRLKEPLLIPTEEEREGYVPNVVYTCGSYLTGNLLVIPYAVSDYASKIATIELNHLIDKILENPE